jgi:hypothetical protein
LYTPKPMAGITSPSFITIFFGDDAMLILLKSCGTVNEICFLYLGVFKKCIDKLQIYYDAVELSESDHSSSRRTQSNSRGFEFWGFSRI